MRPLVMLVHGDWGSGKSWFAQTGPAPRLVLDSEGGAEYTFSRRVVWDNPNDPPPVPDGTWDTCIVRIDTLRRAQQVFAWLSRGKHPFNTVVVDSLSELQKRMVDEISPNADQMRVQDWGDLFRKGESFVRAFRDLKYNPVRPVPCVVYVAGTVERVTVAKKGKDKKKDEEQDQQLKLAPYVQGQLGKTLAGFVDIVGIVEVDDDTDRRYLRVKPRAGLTAKDRTHTFREEVVDITRDDATGAWANTVESMMARITETLDERERGGRA